MPIAPWDPNDSTGGIKAPQNLSLVSFPFLSNDPGGANAGDTYFNGTTFKTYGFSGFFLDLGQYIGTLASQIVTADNLNTGIGGVYGSVTTYLISGSPVLSGAGIGTQRTLARSDHTHDTTGIVLLSVANSWNGYQNFQGGATVSPLLITSSSNVPMTIYKYASVSNIAEIYPYDPGSLGLSSIPLWYIDQYGLTTIGNNTRYTDLGATLFVQSTGSSSTALVLSAFNSSWVGDLQRWLIPLGAFTQQIGSTVNSKGQFVIGGSVALISTSAAMLSIYQSSSNTPAIITRSASLSNVDTQQWQNAAGSIQAKMTRFGELIAGGGVYSGSNPDTNYQSQVVTGTTSTAGFGIKGNAAQADLQRFTNSSNSILSVINGSGQFVIGGSVSMFASANGPTVSSAAMLSVYNSSSINAGIVVRTASPTGVSAFELQRNDGQPIFSVTGNGALWFDSNVSSPQIRWGSAVMLNGGSTPNSLVMTPYANTRFAMTFRGLAGQTGDLIQFQDSNASALAVFNASGQLILGSFGASTTTIGSTGYPGSAYLTIYQNASANAGIIIRRNNGNSNASMIEFQDQGGGITGLIGAFGQVNFRNSGNNANQATMTLGIGTNTAFRNLVLVAQPTAASAAFEIQYGSTGTSSAIFSISPFGQISAGSGYSGISTSSAMISVFNTFPNGQGIVVRGAPSQTANLQEWQSTTAASVVAIDPLGNITASGNVIYNQSTNAQSAASYTLVLSDSGKFVEMNNANLNYLQIPANSVAAFAIGARVDILQTGVGNTIIIPTGTASLNFYSPTSATTASAAGQWAGVTLVKRATDLWAAIGNIK